MRASYPIEKNVPRPPRAGQYPFADMEVGDSFLVSDKARGESARVAARNFRLRNAPDWIFASRREGTGLRIWRTQ